MREPKVSVVIPAFRAAATIGKAVASCLTQVEAQDIIVVHDGPDAESERALSAFERVRVLAEPPKSGAPVCRNKGMSLARTPYVMFLDSDDYIEGPLLTSAAATADETQADLVIGSYCTEDPEGKREFLDPRDRYGDLAPSTVMLQWLRERYTPPCALIWRKSFIESIGGWDEALAKNQDGDLMYRALLNRPRIAVAPEGHGVYVQSDDPKRITNRFTRRTFASQFAVLEKIRVRLPGLDFDPRRELGLAYYSLARLAYTVSVDDIGAAAERAARELGVRGEPGSLTHAICAKSLGLRRKQWLLQKLKGMSLVRKSKLGALVPEPLRSASS